MAKKFKSPTLVDAIQKTGATNRDLAERAHVSFRTIGEARNGFDGISGDRRKAGIAQSITRLALTLELSPEVILKEIGLDPTEPIISRSIAQAKASREDEPEDDSIFAYVAKHGKPRSAVLVNPPIQVKDPNSASIATSILRSILGSINPEWSRSSLEPVHGFHEVESKMQDNADDAPHLCMGLYDIAWRRSAGINVVPVPAISVKAGGISSRKMDWFEIVKAFQNPNQSPRALVVDGDIGQLWLSGPVVYPEKRILKPIKSRSPQDIAKRFTEELSDDFAHGVVLVGDGTLISQVRTHLEGTDYSTVGAGKSDWAPSWGFGIGLSADAPRFKSVLENVIKDDLMGKILPKTVTMYCQLYLDDTDGVIKFDLDELENVRRGLKSEFIAIAKQLGGSEAQIIEKLANSASDKTGDGHG